LITLKSTKNEAPVVYVTDEQLEGWLDDMIYSGDIDGYIKRNAKNVMNNDFLEYLTERKESSNDEDELNVYDEIYNKISAKVIQSDGSSDSGILFEKRLDSILFTPPNQRKSIIEENMKDMTPGFIEYVQDELKTSPDKDNKVVLASILQLIGQVKNIDNILAADEAKILAKNADATLGDQFKKETTDVKDEIVGNPNDQILASLLFSDRDILEDVLNNLHVIDEQFTNWLQNKIDKSNDIEERVGLTSLLQTITSVLERIKEVQGDGVEDVADEQLTMDEVKKKMQEVQMGRGGDDDGKNNKNDSKIKLPEFKVKIDKKETFMNVLQRFQDKPVTMTLEECISLNYDLCDYEFLDMLKKEIAICYQEGANIEAQQYQEIYDGINVEMAKRVGNAQDKLQRILAKRTLPAMESEIVAMVRRNEIDEALTLLIEANTQQAEQAGAKQAADVLRKLTARILLEKERKLPDEQRLLRALIRVQDSKKRKELLFEAFKPAKIMGQEGEINDGPPLISPPAFINVVRQFITNFGNVDKFNIMDKAQLIIDEAQEIATQLYGEGMSPRDQQKLMFEKNTMSVWDLADYEYNAEISGEEVPWRNDKFDVMNPEDVLHDRVKRIGGEQGGPEV
jgi:hypothetical protein